MFKQNCIDTMNRPENLLPFDLRWRVWLRVGAKLMERQTRQLFATVKLWNNRSLQRRELLGLDDAALKDIGICRQDAQMEAAKPFWRK